MALAANSGKRKGRQMVAKAEAAQGQTTINQKAVAMAAETVLVTAEMAAAVAVAAAIATAAWWRQCSSHGRGDGSANMVLTVGSGRGGG